MFAELPKNSFSEAAQCSPDDIGLWCVKNAQREVFAPKNRVFNENSRNAARTCFKHRSESRRKRRASRREVFENAEKTRSDEKATCKVMKGSERGKIEI
jgi:hypothetical protein